MNFRPEYKEYFKQGATARIYDGAFDDVGFYDEVDIKDFKYNGEDRTFYYPCPCGDSFEISLDDLRNGEVVARCPSCSLVICTIYEPEDIQAYL